ncbi:MULTISPECIES: ABC transporter substrate-binding protein [Arthrobacter]|uniref:ABC transporter substrate-binding protein n=2 Tax=Arthrobacter TaxID=1663 RepID=A0ABU9KGH4_9MICC|nr:ABC transporter substrate-binding protein [Arthrobacter sp. YJM1]MDP5225984.1 ABC transporter substrate-binding protein [Arthrobacter sp. YJM1]
MTFTPKSVTRTAALFAVSLLALTACTNASAGGAADASGSSTFDPAAVAKDEALASQVPAAIKARGTLLVGSDTTYPPAEFLGGQDGHTPTGYGADLARAIGAKLGLKTEIQSADFSGILSSLGPKYDLGVSSYTITKERMQAVNFVSYFNAGTAWAVKKGNPKGFSLEDVCGKSIGVQTATIQEDPDLKDRSAKCVAAGKSPINVVSLKDQSDVTTRLVNGGLDAMAADSPIIGYAIQQTGGQLEKLGSTYDSAPEGIAIAKTDTSWAALVQKAVSELMADGSYKKILDTWGTADGAISSSQVNPAGA